MAETIPSSSQLTKYWDASATSKDFAHPIPQHLLEAYFPAKANVLDVGCGYGRLASVLSAMDFQVSGTDTSSAMLTEARKNAPNCEFRECCDGELPYDDDVFNVAIAITLFTSVPSDIDQRQLISEIKRVLKPSGVLFISDMPLQWTTRYLSRYQKGQKRYGQYGVFDLEGGGVVRHHELDYFMQLTSDFTPLLMEPHEVVTMNGNQAQAIRFVGQL
ncbi:MAG: class I SAM-dependent methyltransferase [Phormidesmis sp.]